MVALLMEDSKGAASVHISLKQFGIYYSRSL